MNRTRLNSAAVIFCLAGASLLHAQEVIQAIPWGDLSDKAINRVNVTLEGPLLAMAFRALSDNDPDEAHVKRMLANLKGVYVRSLEFDKDGFVTRADVEKLRGLFRGSNWSAVVDVQERKGDDVGVFVRFDGTKVTGFAVVAAEPRELTVVQISGTLDMNDLAALSGKFGIPNMSMDFAKKGTPAPAKKK